MAGYIPAMELLLNNVEQLRTAVFWLSLYVLSSLFLWGSWKAVRYTRRWFRSINLMRTEVARIARVLKVIAKEHHDARLSQPFPQHRDASAPFIVPPPLPSETSDHWGDDDRATQARNSNPCLPFELK